MIGTRKHLALWGAATLAAFGQAALQPAARAQVLDLQPRNTFTGHPSQVFSDLPQYTSYCFDDFTVTGSGWDITKVTAFGSDKGIPSYNTAVSLNFTTSPDASALGTTYSGVEDASGNLVFTGPIHLAPGSYFLTSYVTRDYHPGGQWEFQESSPVTGSVSYFDNPSGGFGFGTKPFHIDPTHDLAFEIDGTPSLAVPEPSSLATYGLGVLGLGGLGIAKWRKKARAAS